MEYFFQAGKQTSRNLLLLHGTGGDEYSLLETAQFLETDATILSFRGSRRNESLLSTEWIESIRLPEFSRRNSASVS